MGALTCVAALSFQAAYLALAATIGASWLNYRPLAALVVLVDAMGAVCIVWHLEARVASRRARGDVDDRL